MNGEYVGKDGRTYRWSRDEEGEYCLEIQSAFVSASTCIPGTNLPGTITTWATYGGIDPADWPAAKQALDALIEAEVKAPTITYEPVTENQQQYIIAGMDLYPHGKMKAYGETKFEAAEALAEEIADLYEVMWKEHVEKSLSPETPKAAESDTKDVYDDSVEWVELTETGRISRSGAKAQYRPSTAEAWQDIQEWEARTLCGVLGYRKGREVALERVRELVSLIDGFGCISGTGQPGWPNDVLVDESTYFRIREAAKKVKL